jgi:hypothetical protein
MNPQEVVALTAGGVFIIFGGLALLVALVEEVIFPLWRRKR